MSEEDEVREWKVTSNDIKYRVPVRKCVDFDPEHVAFQMEWDGVEEDKADATYLIRVEEN